MKTKNTKPFFSRFLDTQDLNDVAGGCEGPAQNNLTRKFPSDSDEFGTPTGPKLPTEPVIVTLRFPSDSDVISGNGIVEE